MLKIGLIGCGHWGKNYLRVLDDMPEVRLLRVADENGGVLDQLKERHPHIEFTSEAEWVLRDSHIDAVVIATTASTHYPIARQAIERGKHCIVEKPLALEASECEELTELAKRGGLTLMVGHTFLYNDTVRKMREMLLEEESGSLYYLTARRNHLGLIRDDVDALWDLAAHDIAIFSYLVGHHPTSVSAVGRSYLREDRDDVTFLTLSYPGGVVGNIQVSWLDASKIREVVAITQRRRLVFDDLDNLESLRIFEKGISTQADADSFGEFQYLLRDGDILSPSIRRREPLRNLCNEFLECVRSGNAPLTGGADGTMVVRALRAAAESRMKHGQEVPV
jgi:predicted dehydrogenase